MQHNKLTISREIAYDTFTLALVQNQDPNEVLESKYSKLKEPLKKIDRKFIKELVFGGLRWYYKIHWIVQNTSKRELSKVHPDIQSALILGSYQIFYMDKVPDRAAVNESVEYIRKKGHGQAVTFVNGILRSIARRAEYFAKPDKDKQPCDYLALQFSHPKWLVERWHQRFKFNRVKDLLAANNQPPPYTVRINTLKVNPEQIPELRNNLLVEDRNKSERKSLRCCLQLSASPNVDDESLFQKGYYTIQDEASQLVPYLLDIQKDEIVVDACSGPGGKLSQLHELAEGQANLIAIEKSNKQISRARMAFQRLGHKEPVWLEQDFLDFKPEVAPDKILLDAPCSGLGVIRRHPEGKWHKRPDIIPKLASQQRQLLLHALRTVKVGGRVVYSVCSYEKEETTDHFEWILNTFPNEVRMISPIAYIPDYYKKFVTKENILLIFSGNKEAMDGFGAFILEKTANIPDKPTNAC